MCFIKKYRIAFYVLTFILLSFIGFIYIYKIQQIDPYVNYNNIKEINCNVSNIIYPENLDSLEWENYTLYWQKCKCGKRCISETAIQKIYVNYDIYKNQLIHNTYYINDNDHYTFINDYKKCPASIKGHIDSINDGINKIKPYNELMNNNETFICYTINNKFYINKGSNNYLLISLILSSILILIILSFLLYLYVLIIIENYKYYKYKKEQKKLDIIINMDNYIPPHNN